MTHAELVVRRAGPGDEEALSGLAFEYLVWAVERLKAEYDVSWPAIAIDDVRASWEEYGSEGAAFIAERGGEPVGISAVRRLEDGVAEVKRMYVRPEARGLGAGAALLDNVLDHARSLGARIVRLDTVRFMADAQRLYRSRGFIERGPYEGTEIPERLQHHWRFFEVAVSAREG